MGIRSKIGAVTKKLPFLHRFLISLYHIMVLEVWPRLRNLPRARKVEGDLASFLSLQSIRVLSLDLVSPNNDAELLSSLDQNDLTYYQGGWTIYLPPSERLTELMPGLKDYPAGSGVKILRHLEPPSSALYTPNDLRPTPGAGLVRSRTPKPLELLRIAGVLANEKISPIVYDLVELRIGTTQCTAFITEHVERGGEVATEDYEQFITKLETMLEKGCLAVAHGDYRISKDFLQPDCNGNLIKGKDGQCYYIDFQSFVCVDEKKAFTSWSEQHADDLLFGPRRLGKNKTYLYQMVPGIGDAKRETLLRWEIIDALLAEGGVDLHNRLTFDIGCNSGLMSYYALSRGGKWSYGWDRPEIASASQQLLRLLGASRWNTFGTKINPKTDFRKSLPANSQDEFNGMLFYFAVSNHIGFPEDIARLPWQYCVYEGHSGQDINSSIEAIKHSGWTGIETIDILATRSITDGDSPVRSLILFSRSP